MAYIDNRGQLGPIGEDFLSYTFIFVIIGFFLLLVLVSFGDHESIYASIDGFRMGQADADKVAISLAAHYKDDAEAKYVRVIDNKEVVIKLTRQTDCADICKDCAVCLIDRMTPTKLYCGNPLCAFPNQDPSFIAANVRLPVAIKMSDSVFHQGVLEVTLIR